MSPWVAVLVALVIILVLVALYRRFLKPDSNMTQQIVMTYGPRGPVHIIPLDRKGRL